MAFDCIHVFVSPVIFIEAIVVLLILLGGILVLLLKLYVRAEKFCALVIRAIVAHLLDVHPGGSCTIT